MGLFSSVLHVQSTEPEAVITALHTTLRTFGYEPKQAPFQIEGDPRQVFRNAGSLYAVSPAQGPWVTVIDAGDNPWLFDVAPKLSEQLSTYVLALHLHDDDVFLYQLSLIGAVQDEYTSNPQYFEEGKLSKAEVEEVRHNPSQLAAILPNDVTVERVTDLLQNGWWNAYEHNQLDADGLPREDDEEYIEEEERMSEFGALLELGGSTGEYPYTAWHESEDIPWETFWAVPYTK